MLNPKYSPELNRVFSRKLIKKVNHYFRENGLNRKANNLMIWKSILAFSLYVGIYLLIVSGWINSTLLLFFLWALLGLCQAFIGMVIMHDTVHNAYSQNKMLRFLLEIPIIAIGVDSKIWRIEHNVIHHTYTNVENVDQDINPRFVFRFSENQPHKWFHKFQSIYASFIYALLILEWVTIKDFLKTLKYKREKYINSNFKFYSILFEIILKKSIFFFLFLVIPLYSIESSSIIVLMMFLSMLFAAGLYMTVIFQLAHVIPEVSFFLSNKNQAETWHIRQMLTTSNFGMNNKLLTYLVGGLNYQIEHHLFPDVCHVHYPKISKIVQNTAKEYGLPYHQQGSLSAAIKGHFRLLSILGKAPM